MTDNCQLLDRLSEPDRFRHFVASSNPAAVYWWLDHDPIVFELRSRIYDRLLAPQIVHDHAQRLAREIQRGLLSRHDYTLAALVFVIAAAPVGCEPADEMIEAFAKSVLREVPTASHIARIVKHHRGEQPGVSASRVVFDDRPIRDPGRVDLTRWNPPTSSAQTDERRMLFV